MNNLIDAYKRKGIECERIVTLAGRTADGLIIPYGDIEANELIDSGLPTMIAFRLMQLHLAI